MKKIMCDLPGHAGEWVERVDKVSIKQYNAWRKADYETTQQMFSELLTGWNLKNIDGSSAPQPRVIPEDSSVDLAELQRKKEQELKDLEASEISLAQKISTRSITVSYYDSLIAEAQQKKLAARLSPLDNLELTLLPWIVEAVRKSLSEEFQLSPQT